MDKTAQAARQARLAQALRTNLRRRKSADGSPAAEQGTADPSDPDAAQKPAASEAGAKTEL
jgi:hypothetical protein